MGKSTSCLDSNADKPLKGNRGSMTERNKSK